MKRHPSQTAFVELLADPLRFCDLFDLLPEITLYVKDRKSRFIKVNETFLANLGAKSEAEVLGKTDLDLFRRDLSEQYIAEDNVVMNRDKPLLNQAWVVPDRSGRLKWYLSSKIPLHDRDGQVIGIAGVMRDFEKAGVVLEPYLEMQQVVTYILNHYADPIRIEELAGQMHLSVSQFDRKFKKTFQLTPQQFILRVRVNSACQMLTSTDQGIAQVSQMTGFYDQSYFTKQFKQQMGMTPSGYRRKYGKKGDVPLG